MKFSENQMRRQQGYTFTVFILEMLRDQGILANGEIKKAEKIVANIYRPIIRFYSCREDVWY